jgi:HSP20 family protein
MTTPFNQPADGQPTPTATPARGLPNDGAASTNPRVDVVDTPDEIWVLVDLPGFTEDEIGVRADENTVVVSAERRGELSEGRTRMLHERPTKLQRSLPLHASVDASEATATYEHGVCRVKLPKLATERYVTVPFQ